MLRNMSSRTLTEWIAYHNLEPFGDELIDIHLASVQAILANTNRKKGSSPMKPNEFRLWKQIQTFDPQEFFDRLKGTLTFRND